MAIFLYCLCTYNSALLLLNSDQSNDESDENDVVEHESLDVIIPVPEQEIDAESYDCDKGQPIADLKFKFASKKLKRYSCACHKLNLVIRASITRSPKIRKIIKLLNKSNTSIRGSIKLCNIFSKKKCRLRCESLTRWSSIYLVLESVKRAYDRGK